jgi:flagellar M-ring protein FliF
MDQLRQQLTAFWSHQNGTQRLVLIALAIAGIVLVPLFVRWAGTPSYEVAFSGLSEADAGQIVEQLIEDGLTYQLRNSGTILVPSENVYEVRLKMARLGLPQGGTVGFELFNGNTLGMTEFTQRVNYQQALEGELERTIASMESVEAVRVHIVLPEKALLSGDQAPATASVTIQENPSRQLDSAQVSSITHLIASSVEGMQPENVVVVDVNGNLLASGTGENGGMAGQNDTQRAAEIAVAKDIQVNVQRLLDSALGPNRSVVQANVSMDWTERETTVQSFDPETAAIRSSQVVSETYTTSGGVTGGIPGADTNLPPGGEGEATGAQSSDYQRSEEVTNYEITQTETREVAPAGKIERISISVLVDGVTEPDQLNTLQAAISAAAGVDSARGDTLAVESLAFDRTYYEEQATDIAEGERTSLYFQIGQYVLAFLGVAALLWYVQRLLANLRLASTQAWTPVLRPVAQVALPDMAGAGAAPRPQLEEAKAAQLAAHEAPAYAAIEAKIPSPEDEKLQRTVSRLAEENPSTVAEIIQLWLNEDKK